MIEERVAGMIIKRGSLCCTSWKACNVNIISKTKLACNINTSTITIGMSHDFLKMQVAKK